MLNQGVVSLVRQLSQMGIPWWVFCILGPALLYYVSVEAVKELRWFFQGLRYNVSYASERGDIALILLATLEVSQILAGASNGLLGSGWWHLGVAVFWFAVGAVMLITGEKEVADRYHNILVLPILGYLTVSMSPILPEVSWLLRAVMIVLALYWGSCLYRDWKEDRLNQKKWLRENKGLNIW